MKVINFIKNIYNYFIIRKVTEGRWREEFTTRMNLIE